MTRTSVRCLMLVATWLVVGRADAQKQAEPDQVKEIAARLRYVGGVWIVDQSHQDIGGAALDLKDLAGRFKEAKQQAELKQALDRALLDMLKARNPTDAAAALKALAEKVPFGELQRSGTGAKSQLTPEERQRLQSMIEDITRRTVNNRDPASNPSERFDLSALRGSSTASKLNAAELESRAELTRWLAEQAKRLEGVDAIRRSPVLQQARLDLEAFTRNQSMPDVPRFNIDQQLSRLGIKNLPEKLRSNLELSWPSNLKLPNLPRPTLPRVTGAGLGLPWNRPPALPMPDLGSPPAPSGNDAFGVLSLAIIVMLCLLAWKLYGAYRPLLAQTIAQRLAARRWPVNAGALTTRADVIRAFEHLSLSQLGVETRSWHHRDIAAGLGGEEAERRRAAETLAAIYEQARYTPATESLPADTLETARRALTHLAGTAPA